ncbi:MAG: VCBS repeat-containing protein, partial [Deltaproteobacteria bacterium]|nr:VCBS repeat-containing protein [Deltaproteobacteria bacterium]
MLRINSDHLSLLAQRQLSQSLKAIEKALARLSTGERIHSAKDDAAGLAIRTKLDTQIKTQARAALNVTHANSLLQVADGVLESQTQIVQRMRELAVQASNGIISSSMRTTINSELNQLYSEFERVMATSNFNGIRLFDGNLLDRRIQVSRDAIDNFNFNLGSVDSASIFTKIGASGNYSTRATLTPGLGAAGPSSSTAVGDLDGDGYADMVAVDTQTTTLSVFLHSSADTFGSRSVINVGSLPRDVKLADFDGDGNLDVINSDSSSTTVSLSLGNGDGTFQSRTTVSTGTTPSKIRVGDFDKDGNQDFAVTENGSTTIGIFLGNGDGSFQTRTSVDLTVTPAYMALADIDNDGQLDIVAGDSAGTISKFLGNGDGTFQSRATIATGASVYGLELGDLNNDGVLDLVQSAWVVGVGAKIYLGTGGGNFSSASSTVGSSWNGTIGIADVDNDDILDLVGASTFTGRAQVLKGRGDGTFSFLSQTTGTTFYGNLTLADLNGDEAFDIISRDATNSTTLSYYLNDIGSSSGVSDISVTTQSKAQRLLGILSNALDNISEQRSLIGGQLSRLEFSESTLLTQRESL